MADDQADRPTPLDPGLVGFRPLGWEDLPLIHRWLHAPHVARWYGERLSLAEVEAKYGARIAGRAPTRSFLMLYGERPVGYLQVYRIADYPEYAAAVQVE